jgi:CheY-like chemotaxis protein
MPNSEVVMGTHDPAADTATVEVLIVDDQPPFRDVARTLVSLLPHWQVVAEAETGEDAVAAVARHAPSVVLMDINLPGISGIEATRRIMAAHPDARVVLTRRDPDAWFESITNTIFQALRAGTDNEDLMRWRVQTRLLIFTQTFGDRFDRDHVVGVLREHEADVIATVPCERLLVFDVAEGWPPLCGFLGVPIPDAPFPRTNSTDEFRVWTGLTKADEIG